MEKESARGKAGVEFALAEGIESEGYNTRPVLFGQHRCLIVWDVGSVAIADAGS